MGEMGVEEAIEEYRQIVEDKIVSTQAAKKKLDQLIELQRIKVRRLKGERLTDQEIQRALNLLCWNSYAGCCSPAKNCPWNVAVSDALGVDYKELYGEKEKAVKKYLTST
jgi:hypothetical protein